MRVRGKGRVRVRVVLSVCVEVRARSGRGERGRGSGWSRAVVLQRGVRSAGGAADDATRVVVPSARVDADRDRRALEGGREAVQVLREARACPGCRGRASWPITRSADSARRPPLGRYYKTGQGTRLRCTAASRTRSRSPPRSRLLKLRAWLGGGGWAVRAGVKVRVRVSATVGARGRVGVRVGARRARPKAAGQG